MKYRVTVEVDAPIEPIVGSVMTLGDHDIGEVLAFEAVDLEPCYATEPICYDKASR